MTCQSWREWTFCVKKLFIYCGIIAANRIESKKCSKFEDDWSPFPEKYANIRPTAWLHTPAKHILRHPSP
jgi:hypothetical protein